MKPVRVERTQLPRCWSLGRGPYGLRFAISTVTTYERKSLARPQE
jgi:hypothetical protein